MDTDCKWVELSNVSFGNIHSKKWQYFEEEHDYLLERSVDRLEYPKGLEDPSAIHLLLFSYNI